MRARTSTRGHNRRVRIDLNADVAESFGRWRLGDDAALLAPHHERERGLRLPRRRRAHDPRDRRALRRARGRRRRPGLLPRPGGLRSPRDGRRARRPRRRRALPARRRSTAWPASPGTRARYVKPHGALYHRLLDDDEQADAVVSAVAAWDAARVRAHAARGAGPAGQGGGADRRARGLRRPRLPARRAARAAHVAGGGAQRPRGRRPPGARPRRDGGFGSLCVHGDTPGAPTVAQAVRAALAAAGHEVAAFADAR